MSLKQLVKTMNVLAKTNKLELVVASTMLAVTADRIFAQGRAADGNEIGTYSKGYLKTRVKDNYPNSSKVILQATRQMVNDWSVVNTGDAIGLGFKNQANADKSGWVEETYDKTIFDHTKDELGVLQKVIDKTIKEVLNG